MTSDDSNRILSELEKVCSPEQSTHTDTSTPREAFAELRQLARNPRFLAGFDKQALGRLVHIFITVDPSDKLSQLDCVATIANVLYIKANLRQAPTTTDVLRPIIPILLKMLDGVSERSINSESQYQGFFPIFRLYFFLSHIPSLLEELRTSTLKISAKLLNFVTMSTLDSTSLNAIIIEILKILYTTLHQVGDTNGIDSSYVLSCNKFSISYAKHPTTTSQYDEILQLFGNVLMVISPEYSRNYMLNKIAFARNQVCLLNKMTEEGQYATQGSPVPGLLTLDAIMTIDNGESGIEQLIHENLNVERLRALLSSETVNDPHFPVVLQSLEEKIGVFNTQENSLNKVLQQAAGYKQQSAHEHEASPRFEDLSEREQDEEIAKMSDLFGKLEKNGIFKIQMK